MDLFFAFSWREIPDCDIPRLRLWICLVRKRDVSFECCILRLRMFGGYLVYNTLFISRLAAFVSYMMSLSREIQ